ncbi:MAG TPA: hypothetical protein VFQ44_18815 [Streptosporangiaceae bacterium]|nr:hypothetical protein [Streptosporangiaceae bacterium]
MTLPAGESTGRYPPSRSSLTCVAYFFRHEYGRDLPLNAYHQAELHQLQAAAPADVGGMAAGYYETHSPSFDFAELEAERLGIRELYAEPSEWELEAE